MDSHRIAEPEAPQVLMDMTGTNIYPVLAYIHDASEEAFGIVMDAEVGDDDGRSPWKWLRLPNGDLMLGTFPRGGTYERVERDAAFPEEALPSEPRGATRADLDNAPEGSFLYCPECGVRYSATAGDYWNMPPEATFTCSGGGEHDETPMILATEQRQIVPVTV